MDATPLSESPKEPEVIRVNGINYYVLDVFYKTIALCARVEDVTGGAAYIPTVIVQYPNRLTRDALPAGTPAAAED
jgi:hypothetical protein